MHYLFAILMFSQVFLLDSCRSRKKAANISENVPSLSVTMKDMRDADKKQTNLRYTLSGCGEGEIAAGKLDSDAEGEDPVVKFNVNGITSGDLCQVDVKIDSVEAYPSEIKFTDSDLLMYKGTNGSVNQGIKGDFSTIINLQPKYFHKVSPNNPTATYTIESGVKFSEPVKAPNTLAAYLFCDPEIKQQPSVFSPASNVAGTFTFKVVHNPNFTNQHGCTKFMVYEGDTLSFLANLNPSSIKYSATAGQSIKLTNNPIPLQKVVATPTNVILETIPGTQCDPKTEVFDTVTKKCVPKNK